MAKRDRSVGAFLTMLIVFALSAALFFFLIIPKRETFEILQSSRTLALANSTPDKLQKRMNDLANVLTDKGELLLYHRGYQFVPKPGQTQFTIKDLKDTYQYKKGDTIFQRKLDDGIYMKDFDVITCSFNEVHNKITCIIKQFYDNIVCTKKLNDKNVNPNACVYSKSKTLAEWEKAGKPKTCNNFASNRNSTFTSNIPKCTKDIRFRSIYGPIYVMITQAPYYRNAQNDPIYAQYTLSQMNFKVSKNTDDPIYYYVQVIFGCYKKDGTVYWDPTNKNVNDKNRKAKDMFKEAVIPALDDNNFSNHDPLFIQTNESPGFPTFGGCGTTYYPYTSICLGPKKANGANDAKDEKKTKSVFAVLYKINDKYPQIKEIMATNNI